MRTALIVALVFLLAMPPPARSQDKDVEITKSPGFILKRLGQETCFDTMVRVKPDTRNRLLRVELLEGEFVRRGSDVTLEGERSKISHDFRYCIYLEYEVEFLFRATVNRSDGDRVSDQKTILVAGAE